MDILEKLAIEIPCSACGGRYDVTLKQILLSQQMLHREAAALSEGTRAVQDAVNNDSFLTATFP